MAKGDPAPEWGVIDSAAQSIEQAQGQYGARVSLIETNATGTPELWYGTYGNAPVIAADSTVIHLSDGSKFDAAGAAIEV